MNDILLIVLVIIIVVVSAILLMYNKLVRLRNNVKQSKSGIDVCLKQRFDLVPNLVQTVKGYAKHEEELYENIATLRSSYTGSQDLKTGETLNKQVNKLIAVAENYPELKANEQFLALQRSLEKIENQLQAARRIYNMSVTAYNNKIETVPSNLVASLFGFEQALLFNMEDSERKNIVVDF